MPERKRDSDTQLRTENVLTFDPRCITKKVKLTDVVSSSGRLLSCQSAGRSPERVRAGCGAHSSARPLLTFTVALSVRKVRAGLQNPGSIRRPGAQLFLLYLSWWTCCSWCFSGQWWESDKNLLLFQIFPSLRPALLALTGEPGFGPEALSFSLSFLSSRDAEGEMEDNLWFQYSHALKFFQWQLYLNHIRRAKVQRSCSDTARFHDELMKMDNLGELDAFCGLFSVLMALFYRHLSFELLYSPRDKPITRQKRPWGPRQACNESIYATTGDFESCVRDN